MTPRHAAVLALDRVLNRGGYSNLVLRAALDGVSEPERPFASALFYGTLERQLTLDAVLAKYLTQPPSRLDGLVHALLLSGFYQLLYMETPEHAAVNETVALVRLLGRSRQAGFVNAALRAFLRDGKPLPTSADPDEADSLAYSCPVRLVRLWKRAYGAENARRILESTLGRAPVYLRVNTLRVTAEALLARFTEAGFSASAVAGLPDALEVRGAVERLPGFAEGLFHVEDAAAQYAALLLGAKPGETVADLCAAPGGKSFTVAEAIGDDGVVYARDLTSQRARLITDGARRLGLGCIRAEARDAREPGDPALRVLCDVPCSGLGVIRHKPEIKYRPAPAGQDILQREILEAGAARVLPGGTLLYATCTLDPAENEDVAAAFLRAHPEFGPLPIDPPPFASLRYGGHTCTLCPGVCDGFFLARFTRV